MATQNEPNKPVALYEGPRVTWFRGWSFMALVAACVTVGAFLGALWPRIDLWLHPRHVTVTPIPVDVKVPSITLDVGIELPPDETTLINVWLQNCPDCMPAFSAWRDVSEQLDHIPTINVSFGSAEQLFAKRFHVDERLVSDEGSMLVQPLGITTFTTLLVDRHGHVLFRDAPTSPNFAARVKAAYDVARHFDRIELQRELIGHWTGHYTCRQGITALKLDVTELNGELMAHFSFGAHVNNPGVPSGEFRMRGSYEPIHRRLEFNADESDWIAQPLNYVTVDLKGAVNELMDTFAGDVATEGCTTFLLRRPFE
jgi:hypothetical protein